MCVGKGGGESAFWGGDVQMDVSVAWAHVHHSTWLESDAEQSDMQYGGSSEGKNYSIKLQGQVVPLVNPELAGCLKVLRKLGTSRCESVCRP